MGVMQQAPKLLSADEVDYLREPCRKSNPHGGDIVHRAWSRFKEVAQIIDGAGATHSFGLHAKGPRQRKRQDSKWPSKVTIRRQIAKERDAKAYEQCRMMS